MLKKILDYLMKLILVVFGIFTLLLLYWSLFDKQVILNALEWVKTSVENLGYLSYVVIAVFAFIESFPII